MKHHYYVTNLAKCTQLDARPLPDSVYPVYYPVGNGMRNIDKAIADLQFILEEEDHE